MKKFIYALTVLLMTAALSSCDGEIKNVTTKNLVGTWDLVSETTVFTDGTKTTTEKSGESIIIGENTYTVVSGNRQTEPQGIKRHAISGQRKRTKKPGNEKGRH